MGVLRPVGERECVIVGLVDLDIEGDGLDDCVFVLILLVVSVEVILLEEVPWIEEDIVGVAVADFELVVEAVNVTDDVDVFELLEEPVIVADCVLLFEGKELTVLQGVHVDILDAVAV